MGMAFNTAEGRQQFFRNAQYGGVREGTAMQHAASTNLGVWGSSEALKADCAAIFACEIQTKFHLAKPPQIGDVLNSKAFTMGFLAARREPEENLHGLLRSFNVSSHTSGMQAVRDAGKIDVEQVLSNLHMHVLAEACDTNPAYAASRHEAEAVQEKPVKDVPPFKKSVFPFGKGKK